MHGDGRRLYATCTAQVHRVSSPRVAETAKLLENTFRSVNIALANELALACRALGVVPWEVIAAAATKPFGFMPFYPDREREGIASRWTPCMSPGSPGSRASSRGSSRWRTRSTVPCRATPSRW